MTPDDLAWCREKYAGDPSVMAVCDEVETIRERIAAEIEAFRATEAVGRDFRYALEDAARIARGQA